MLLGELAKKLAEQVKRLDLRASIVAMDNDTLVDLATNVLSVMQPKAGESRNEHYVAQDAYTQLKSLLEPHLAEKPVEKQKPTLRTLMVKVLRLEREMQNVAGVPVRLTPTLGEGNVVTAAGLAGPWGGMVSGFMDNIRCGGHEIGWREPYRR